MSYEDEIVNYSDAGILSLRTLMVIWGVMLRLSTT